MQKRLIIAGFVTMFSAANGHPSGHDWASLLGFATGLVVLFGLVYLIAWGCGVGRG